MDGGIAESVHVHCRNVCSLTTATNGTSADALSISTVGTVEEPRASIVGGVTREAQARSW